MVLGCLDGALGTQSHPEKCYNLTHFCTAKCCISVASGNFRDSGSKLSTKVAVPGFSDPF